MHLFNDTEAHHRFLNDPESYLLKSPITYYIRRTPWSVSQNLIVLPLDHTPDFFLGLCIVEGIEVPEGLKICNNADYFKTIDNDKSIDAVYSLAYKF